MPSCNYNKKCVCPFYQYDVKLRINCADEEKTKNLFSAFSVIFPNGNAKHTYLSKFCESIKNYNECCFYKVLSK